MAIYIIYIAICPQVHQTKVHTQLSTLGKSSHLKTQAAAVSIHPQHFTGVFFREKKNETGTPLVCSIRVCKLPLRGEVLTRLFVQVFFDLGWDLFWGFCCFSRTCTRSPQNVPKALKTASPALFSQLCNHNFRHWPTGNETASMSPANFSTSSLWRLLWPHRFFSDIKSMRKNPVQSC